MCRSCSSRPGRRTRRTSSTSRPRSRRSSAPARLGPRHRLRARARRSPRLPAARQDARRLLVDQRDDLHPRQPGRLRRVEPSCRAGAGTTCCPTSCAPRTTTRGASEHHGVGGPLRVSDSLARTGLSQAFLDAAAARGPAGQRGLQRPRAGRLRLVPAHHARRPARQHGGLLPAPGHGPPEPHGRDPRPRPPGALRRHPRRRRRGLAAERAARVPRRARGHRLRPAPTSRRRSCGCPGIGRPDELALLQVPTVAEVPGVGLGLQDHPTAGVRPGFRGAGEPQGRARPRRTSRCGRPRAPARCPPTSPSAAASCARATA